MDLGYNIALLSDAADDFSDAFTPPTDPELAYPRPEMSRALAGALLCQARLGSISSVMTIDADMCGSESGCDGRWYCLTGKAPEETTCLPGASVTTLVEAGKQSSTFR